MSFLDVIAALGRRWYVTVAGLFATVALLLGASTLEPPVYTARGLVLLVPSQQMVGKGGNPFLALGGLDLPARVVVAYYESDVAKARFTSGSADSEYVVAIEESTRGPVISVDVTDSSPEGALATLEELTTSVPVELRRLQEEVDAPENAIVSTLVLAKDEEAEADNSGTVRMIIAAAGVGLVVTVVGAVAVDGMARSRMRGRKRVSPAKPKPEPKDPSDGDPEAPDATSGAKATGAKVAEPKPAGSKAEAPQKTDPEQAAAQQAEPSTADAGAQTVKPFVAKPPTVKLPTLRPPSVQPQGGAAPDDRSLPPWHNPPLESRERRRDEAAARASSAESR
ncbi:hypothetical protein GCM10010413_03090 [Promicromonospora sukumoe]|uniref:Capsular polysaccharide biosynthesis protein n=1 Tax=Promicromonospora sukumoe TaxID=88382 RepID=A0A7W3JEW8_9MICO|nr:hypothetical protein [Promicromonospora sukumoe]MBA8811561.1 hypothetical protein [Promicromonospora sukumoe]